MMQINFQNPYLNNSKLLFQHLSIVRKKKLDEKQEKAFLHKEGPLWIVAGPGSGKTEVLCWCCFKLMLVDNVPPNAILITTFTEKAAKNLVDRLNEILIDLEELNNKSLNLDIHQLKIGTLHSLCNEILLEYKYENYENRRLMDEFEQIFFILKNCTFINSPTSRRKPGLENEFWNYFGYKRLNKFQKIKAAITLLDRIVEDNIYMQKLENSSDENLQNLYKMYKEYKYQLDINSRCDYAHLQKIFLEFLNTEQGHEFIYGDPENNNPGIQHVLVDEYQDTNPIQEEIYFKIADRPPHNITIVGDDDQSMYRFRGANVDCIVNFDQRCMERWKIRPKTVQLIYNYRSYHQIVDFFNEYISYHPNFQSKKINGKIINVRAPGKKPMSAARKFQNKWNSIYYIIQQKEILCDKIAEIIKYIIDNKKVEDPSQIAILCRSTKRSPNNAEPLLKALENKQIPYYNPRGREVHENREIKEILGAIISIIDPNKNTQNNTNFSRFFQQAIEYINNCRNAFQTLVNITENNDFKHRELKNYVSNSIKKIEENSPRSYLNVSFHSLFYRILNLPPFNNYIKDPIKSPRLGVISDLLERYGSVFYSELIRSSTAPCVKRNIVSSFYTNFIQTIINTGLNEFEEIENLIPPGYVQVMTYHQAKGLEFPYVFLMDLEKKVKPGPEHLIETILNPLRKNPINLFENDERAKHDLIRRIYVGISRAEIGAILCAKKLTSFSKSEFLKRLSIAFGSSKDKENRATQQYAYKKNITII
ncbi:MAG: UvrD-helicase domain-containing protein [Promethearchaeota archaeon]